jgi:hypothetical protein
LFFGRRLFGDWFREFGRVGILFVDVSLPLALV